MATETPKGPSSRLLSMKFMQRAAASAQSTPGSDSDAPSAKKRKLGHKASQDDFDLQFDQASVQAAVDEREAKRKAALEQHVGSDTHWVLDSKWAKSRGPKNGSRRVVYVGYGDFDQPDDDESESIAKSARTSTKNYKASKDEKTSKAGGEAGESSGENSEAESDEGDGSPGTPTSRPNRSRSGSRSSSKQRKEASKAKEFREKRKKKDIKLNQLVSISGSGGSPSSQNKSMTCYVCQQPGHKAADCPKKGQSSSKRG